MAINPTCPKCNSHRTDRRRRSNILHMLLLHRFGKYPWQCNDCMHRFTFPSRGKRKRDRGSTNAQVGFPQAPTSRDNGEAAGE